MIMRELHLKNGAHLAPDNIPLHYGNLKAEYNAALSQSILLDRSHEGRILLTGDDRHDLLNRLSTNSLVGMQAQEGRATIFVNPNARILDRVMVYNQPTGLLLITQPGRGQAVANYVKRNVFFKDRVVVVFPTDYAYQFSLHGPASDAIIRTFNSELASSPALTGTFVEVGGTQAFIARNKPLVGSHWSIATTAQYAVEVYSSIMQVGEAHGLTLAGSLTYNTLRIRAGIPAGRELSSDYIPLEVGLWDEVSFNKGCYTGQEIIARMESRGQLARTLVKLQLSGYVEAPAQISSGGQNVGTLTSSVEAPDGEIFALGVIKTRALEAGTTYQVGPNAAQASVDSLAGSQPTMNLSAE